MKNLTFHDIRNMTRKEVMALPVLKQGQADDLVAEYTEPITNIPTRVWRSRMEKEDGQEYLLELEQYTNSRWIITAKAKKMK